MESQCFTYLKSGLTVRNCVRSYLLASAKKSWISLATFVRNFIIVHFDEVKKIIAQEINEINALKDDLQEPVGIKKRRDKLIKSVFEALEKF